MKLEELLKQRNQVQRPIKHVCKPQGVLIQNGEKEVLETALQGLRSTLEERLKDYESKETTFLGFQRLQKEYTYLQEQITVIETLERKL